MTQEQFEESSKLKDKRPSMYSIPAMAEKFGITNKQATKLRLKYLAGQLVVLCDYILEASDEPSKETISVIDEMLKLCGSIRVKALSVKSNSGITAAMIQQARDRPIDTIVDFKNGNVACFAHEDKSPSMYHATRSNRVNCPVCNRQWDTIQVVMERDGMTFGEAVRKLCTA